jgi:hypothetical protein
VDIKKILLIILAITGCTDTKDALITQKNNCYNSYLSEVRRRDAYTNVHSAFADTFAVIKASRPSPSLLAETIDSAVFFTKDGSGCILLVLERMDDLDGTFGSARSYRGKLSEGRWRFDRSMWFLFPNEFYKKYQDNSFENISQLARYSVLTEGDFHSSGCLIDEVYWFKTLTE